MALFHEAGFFSLAALALFVLGLVLVVRRPDGAHRVVALAAPTILALGLVGAGLGQRLVDRYVETITDPAEKVVVLSLGTREASANHLLAGVMAAALAGIGAAVSRGSRREG